jgi:uridine phosphorylase
MHAHIHLSQDPRHARVLTCGAPERAARIAEFLQDAKPLAKNREYHSYLGKYEGQDILVISHGVGSAGAGICFQEVINAGAKAIVRLGTAGGLQDFTQIGDLVVATTWSSRSGCSRRPARAAPDTPRASS